MPDWVELTLDEWLDIADIRQGKLFRCVSRKGRGLGNGGYREVVWHIVKECAGELGISKLVFQEFSGISSASLHTLRKDSAKALMSANLCGCKPTRSACLGQPSHAAAF
jgi:hypothetical protein